MAFDLTLIILTWLFLVAWHGLGSARWRRSTLLAIVARQSGLLTKVWLWLGVAMTIAMFWQLRNSSNKMAIAQQWHGNGYYNDMTMAKQLSHCGGLLSSRNWLFGKVTILHICHRAWGTPVGTCGFNKLIFSIWALAASMTSSTNFGEILPWSCHRVKWGGWSTIDEI